MPTEERVGRFGTAGIIEQYDSLPLDDFTQEFECAFVDESYSYFPYDLILPCTSDDVQAAEDVSDIRRVAGRLVAGFDVGRTRDKSELAVFEQRGDRYVCVMLRSYEQATFAAQEAELRRLLNTLPIARLSIDNSGIGMNLAENLAREFPQVVPENVHQRSQGAVGGGLQDSVAAARGGTAQGPQAGFAGSQHQAARAAIG